MQTFLISTTVLTKVCVSSSIRESYLSLLLHVDCARPYFMAVRPNLPAYTIFPRWNIKWMIKIVIVKILLFDWQSQFFDKKLDLSDIKVLDSLMFFSILYCLVKITQYNSFQRSLFLVGHTSKGYFKTFTFSRNLQCCILEEAKGGSSCLSSL